MATSIAGLIGPALVPPATGGARGKIDVVLKGKKLCGGFALVRTRTQGRHEQWLLIKERDVCSNSFWDIESPEFDRSVLTGRTLKEIAKGQSPKKFRVARARA